MSYKLKSSYLLEERAPVLLKGVRMATVEEAPETLSRVEVWIASSSEVCREYYGCDQFWGQEEPRASGETTGFLSVILESCDTARPQILLVPGRESLDKNPTLF